MSTAAQEATPKPNFVFVLADDMRKDDLKHMPKTGALLGDGGARFENAFVSYALCCPSRATIMRGQYAHNTGVWDHVSGPDGGWEGYQTTPTKKSTPPRACATPATGPASSAST